MSSEEDGPILAQVNSLNQPPRVPKEETPPLRNTAAPAQHKPDSAAKPHSCIARELPRNVQDLLRGYFQKHQTTRVPSEIYYIQLHRVFSTLDGR